MDNQVITIAELKKQLNKKNSVEMLMLEKDKHLGEKAESIQGFYVTTKSQSVAHLTGLQVDNKAFGGSLPQSLQLQHRDRITVDTQ